MAKKKGKVRKRKIKKAVQKTTTDLKRRSPVAHTALLRKGGVHQKSRSSERQKQKRTLRKAVTDYGGGRQVWHGKRKSDAQKGFVETLLWAA